ncbi:hypothetical protein [uncultured Thiodictyon sp.]|uniref:hypothetical protein n=1 Tax=uncultured Thiodictyon sp. TaxID=1846217 RepID=UPI0025CBA700|nr:hypothetical protein [uncultured Thiodictyon sp.]
MSADPTLLLGALEEALRAALVERLGPTVAVATGPAQLPAPGSDRLVAIAAVTWDLADPSLDLGVDQSVADHREPAFLEQTYTLTPVAGATDLPLPAAAQGQQLVQVETPPGRLARPGDAWRLDQGQLRFYRAPTGPVAVRTRGERPVRGYRETLPCRVLLHLDAWSPTAADADALMLPALGAVLGRLFDLDLIALGRDAVSGFEVRLLRPRLRPAGMRRTLAEVARRTLARTRTCRLVGELELTLALDEPDAQGIIESIKIRLEK